jgi:CRP-like cAMP-binding protein
MRALLERPKLEDHPFVAGASLEFIQELAKVQKEVGFKSGEILFRKGDYADKFFLVLEGAVEIEIEGNQNKPKVIVQTLGPGDLVGWSWLFEPYCWHFSARAKTDGKALCVNGPSLLVSAETNHEFGYELMKRLSRNLIHRLVAVSDALADRRKNTKDPEQEFPSTTIN